MSEITPNFLTPTHKQEVSNNQPVTEETIRKIIQNNNFLHDLRPIRSIVFVEVNQSGVPVLDISIWQECNGSEITNPNSPLRTIGAFVRNTPDLRGRYVRSSNTDTSVNIQAGDQNHDLLHSHTGFTQATPANTNSLEQGGSRRVTGSHVHAIADALTDGFFLDSPKYTNVIAYMRVA